MLPDGVMAVCMYVCIEAAPRRGIGGPIAAKDLHEILNVLIEQLLDALHRAEVILPKFSGGIVLDCLCPNNVINVSSASMDRVRIFFNAGYASVASTGAWPGRGGTGCCDGAWPGVTRAWPGSKIWKLLSRHKGQVGSDIKELLDELQSCFLCALMVSICKGLAKRPRHSRSISHKACPGNPASATKGSKAP